MILSRNSKNRAAGRGLVKKSAKLSFEATQGTTILPSSTSSRIYIYGFFCKGGRGVRD